MVIRILAVPDSLLLHEFDAVFRAVLDWDHIGFLFRSQGQELIASAGPRLFTLHGARDVPIETCAFIRRDIPLCRIVIPLRQGESVMIGLRACGVTETTVYPDLGGLAKELIAEYGGLY